MLCCLLKYQYSKFFLLFTKKDPKPPIFFNGQRDYMVDARDNGRARLKTTGCRIFLSGKKPRFPKTPRPKKKLNGCGYVLKHIFQFSDKV